MKSFLDIEIEELKNNLTKMGGLVEEQFQKILRAIEVKDTQMLKGIKEKDLEIDAFDVLHQTQCENIFAIHQPVASDLRFVMATLLINNQLERCGDLIVKISNRLKRVIDKKDLVEESKIFEMAGQCFKMLSSSIDSFINEDQAVANEVINEDVLVDNMKDNCFEFFMMKMQSDSKFIEPCTHLLVLTRHLERLADHTTNIAENVLFKINGRVVSHRFDKDKAKFEEEIF